MESKKINQLATELAPELSDLTIIGDPTTGISKKITLSQMASLFTGTVEEYPNLASFPLVGTADTIYIALDTNIIYRWNTGTSAYVELSPNIVTSLVFNDANGFDGTISLVGSTATLTITTALTQGSIGFIGASGALTQDNSNFFWDNTNKRLGINTNAPTTAIDAFGSGIIGRLNGTSTNNAFLGFASAGTNKWSIGNVQSDHRFRIYSETNTAELVSVLQTGEVGIGIANPLTKLHIFGGASALIANLDANTSVAKSISFRSGNSSRINLEVSGTESGSNAGADLFIRRYSDAGALIDTPLTITRSTGYATFSGFLGIGATPATPLHITTTSLPLVRFTVGSEARVHNISGVNNGRDLIVSPFRTFTVQTGNGIAEGFINLNAYEDFVVSTGSSYTTRLTIASTGASTFTNTLNINTDSNIIRFGNLLRWGFQRPAADNRYVSFYRTLHTTGEAVWTVDGDNGNIGIGNTPTFKFDIETSNLSVSRFYSNATGKRNNILIQNGANFNYGVIGVVSGTGSSNGDVYGLGYSASGSTAFTNVLNWTSVGNVGIGTNVAPAVNGLGLAIYASDYPRITLRNSTSGDTTGDGLQIAMVGANVQYDLAESGYQMWTTGGTERMRINANGYLKISPNGTYSGAGVSYHEIISTAQSSDLLFTRHTATDPYGLEMQFNGASPNNTTNWFWYAVDTTNAKAIIYSNGTFGSRTGTYGSIISDEKYKQDIFDANSQWEDIKKLRVVNFKFKQDVELEGENALRQIGFIAQEVEKVSPNLVYESTDRDSGETWKSVKTSIIEIKAIKALQEAMAKIEILEEKVKQLELK